MAEFEPSRVQKVKVLKVWKGKTLNQLILLKCKTCSQIIGKAHWFNVISRVNCIFLPPEYSYFCVLIAIQLLGTKKNWNNGFKQNREYQRK